MRKPIVLCAMLAVLCAACGKIRHRLDELEDRMEKLEELCVQMNTNIGSLQTIVTALQGQDYVTGVAPIMQGEKEVGYTITFAKASPVTIYQHEAAAVPEIGVKRDEDGVYYWTLDGEWLTGEEGNRLRAEGKDGESGAGGVTPQFRVTEEYWEISYDGGETWTRAGKATGENGADGEPGGDSIFKSVTQDENNVTFRLQSGEEIILPKKSAFTITFSKESPLIFEIGETKTILYEVKGGNEHNVVKAEILLDDGGYTMEFKPESATSGSLTIATNIPTYGRIIVSASDGNTTIMVPLDLEMKPLIGKDTVTVVEPGTLKSLLQEYEPTSITKLTIIGNPNASDLRTLNGLPNLAELDLSMTNMKAIPAEAFYKSSSSTSIILPKNLEVIGKSAFEEGRLRGELVIPESVMSIEEKAFLYCGALTGKLIIPESVTSIGYYAFGSCSGFTGELVIPKSITLIENCVFLSCSGFTGDLIIPESVTSIEYLAFGSCSGFTGDLIIPESVTSIGYLAFGSCSGFTGLKIPESVTSIESHAFLSCSGFTGDLVIPESVTSIGEYAFYGCSGFTGNLVIPGSITSVEKETFHGCSGFTGLVIPENVTFIGESAFYECSGLTGDFIIPENVTSIGERAFMGCSGLRGKCYCKCITPPLLEYGSLPAYMEKILYVPVGCAEKYRTAEGWKSYGWKEIIEMEF